MEEKITTWDRVPNNQLKSFRFAFNGLTYFFKNEQKAKIHSVLAIIAIIAGIFLKLALTEWCILTISISIVFIAEIINSAIEKFVDLVSPGYQKKAGIVKDIAAGAVLVSSINALAIGILIFLPKIFALFNSK